MKTPLCIAAIALSLSACASLIGPSSDEIARLPVVRYGQPAPGKDFVLHYPAGADLPVVAKIVGNLFEKTDQTPLKVRLKQDVFLYRNKVSFDGKTWYTGHDKVAGSVWLSLPGDKEHKWDGQSPGELGAEFNLK